MTEPQPPTPDQLDEWEGLANNATAGPWVSATECTGYHASGFKCDFCRFKGRNAVARLSRKHYDSLVFTEAAVDPDRDGKPEDDQFIAVARTAVPALIAEVRRLRMNLNLHGIEGYPHKLCSACFKMIPVDMFEAHEARCSGQSNTVI